MLTMPEDSLRIGRSLYDVMLEHALAAYPLEACGLLAGENGRVLALYAVENRLRSTTTYEMEPRQQIAAMLHAEETEGLTLLAIYHSHPRGPAAPSPRDVAQAAYPQLAQLIISLNERTRPIVRTFSIRQGHFTEIDLFVE